MNAMQVDLGGGRERTLPVVLPSNSHNAKAKAQPAAKPKLEKITTGTVKERKKPIFARAAHSMVTEDGSSVFQYVVMEVLVPAAKNMLSDAVSQGIDRMLYGDSGRRSSTRPGYTNYGTSKVTPLRPERREISRTSRARHDFRDIVLDSRGDAEDVLDTLGNLIDKYEMATVADLYELVGIEGEFTDDKWGWLDLSRARVRHVREGYLLDLPPTEPIE
jgi:hypothetical protein